MRNVEVDKLVCIHVLKKERDMVDGEVEIGIEDPFGTIDADGNILPTVRAFSPSESMDDAMEAAEACSLFVHYALRSNGGLWHICLVDREDSLQNYVRASTPALAVSLACLKLQGIDIHNI